MSEEDDANYRLRIAEVLNRHGFGWVIGQVEAQIAEGKLSTKQVSEYERVPASADPMFTIRRPRSRRASLLTTEPFTETERLEILLQAIEAAIIQRSMIEQAIFEQVPDVSAIRFEPENPVGEGLHILDLNSKATATDLEAEASSALGDVKGRDRAGS